MSELTSRNTSSFARFGGQPIAVGTVALAIVLLGIGSITLWRAYTGTTPETDRVVASRQLQARTAQASEQLVEKTKGLEATQQESIDGLRQSSASAQASEPATPPASRKRSAGGSAKAKPHAIRSANRKRGKTQG